VALADVEADSEDAGLLEGDAAVDEAEQDYGGEGLVGKHGAESEEAGCGEGGGSEHAAAAFEAEFPDESVTDAAPGKVTNDRYQEGKSGDRLLFLVAHVGRSKLFKEYAEALADIGDGGGGGG